MNKRKISISLSLISIISIALLVGIEFQSPIASATPYTWSQSVVATQVVGGPGLGGSVHQVQEIHWTDQRIQAFSQHGETSNRLVRYSTNNGGASWSTITIDGSNNPSIFDISRVGDSAYLCWSASTGADLYVEYTHDAGISWSAAVQAQSTGSVGDDCAVWAIDDSTVVIIYGDNTNGKFKSTKSTDGGASFASPVDVDTCASTGGKSGTAAGKDANNGVVIFRCSTTNTYRACKTTDGAATWINCQSLTSVTEAGNLVYIKDGTYIASDIESSTTYSIIKTTNNGTNWALQAGPILTLSSSYKFSSIVKFNNTRWGAFACASGTGTNIVTYSETKDAGLTWSTEESASVDFVSSSITWSGDGFCWGDLYSNSRVSAFFSGSGSCGGFGCSSLAYTTAVSSTSTVIGNSAQSAAITHIVGFDVDDSSQSLIIRAKDLTGDDTGIRALAPFSLEETDGGEVDTKCDNRNDNVLASDGYVAYLTCDNAGDAHHISIRNGTSLNSPVFTAGGCSNDVCPQDVLLNDPNTFCTGSVPDKTTLKELDDLQTFKVNYQGDDDNDNNRAHSVVFTFSTTGGIIGMFAVTIINNDCDHYAQTEAFFPSANEVDQMSHWQTSNGQLFLAAAQGGAAPVSYGLSTTNERLGTDIHLKYVATHMSAPNSYTSHGAATAIWGAEDKILYYSPSDSKVYLIDRASGNTLFSYTATGTKRGVTLSTDGKFGSFVDGSNIRIINTTSGTITGSITKPSGTLVRMKLSQHAQQLWYATDGTPGYVYRYAIVNATTGNSTCEGSQCGEENPNETPSPTNTDSSDINDIVNPDSPSGKILYAVVVIVILSAFGLWLGMLTGSGLAIGGFASAFASLGLVATWKFGWIPGKALFIIVFLVALIVIMMFKRD